MRWSLFCNKVPGCRTAYLKRDSSTSVFPQILESFFRTAAQLLLELLLLFFSFVSFVVLTYVYEVFKRAHQLPHQLPHHHINLKMTTY